MTQREFFNVIVSANISEDITNQANEYLAKLDNRNNARASATSKKMAETNAPIIQQIKTFLASNAKSPASAVGIGVGQSTNKVSALMSKMVESGVLTRTQAKSGKSKVYVYSLAETDGN